MLRNAAAALLFSTALVAGPALAQTSTAPSSSSPTASATPSGKFVTEQGMSQFRASKFVGLDVYGPDNEKIGDISEILIDGSGNAQAVVIGVGGFLGIGQKNVAVPWSALTWMNERPAARSAAANTPATTSSPAATGAPGTTAGTSTTGGTAPATTPMTGTAATTGSTAPATTPMTGTAAGNATQARSPAEQAAYNGYPDHAKVSLTKQELQDAPAFRYVSDTTSGSASGSGSGSGGSNATRPAQRQ